MDIKQQAEWLNAINELNNEAEPVLMPIITGKVITTQTPVNSLVGKYQLTQAPPDEVPLIAKAGIKICTLCNHSLVIGKKKSRKSLLTAFMVKLLKETCNDCTVLNKVLFIDTEQGKAHVWKQKERVEAATKEAPFVFISLRGVGIEERKAAIMAEVEYHNPMFVVIDGVRDLLSDINNVEQVAELIIWIEALTLYNGGLHVMNVLHQNKNDNNARGHLGTELSNKCEVTIMLSHKEGEPFSLVSCESARDEPFNDFTIQHGIDGLPYINDPLVKSKAGETDAEAKEFLREIFKAGAELERGYLENEYAAAIGKSKATAQKRIETFIKRNWLIKNGDRFTKARYKLAVEIA